MIRHSTELMKNHSGAQLLPAQASFEAMMTSGGHSMLFCIDSDGVLNLIIESPGSKTGWTISDLSSKLKFQHGGKKITVQKFCIVQNTSDSLISIALAAHAEDEYTDCIYALLRMSNADGSDWMTSPEWTSIPMPPGADVIESSMLLAYRSNLGDYPFMQALVVHARTPVDTTLFVWYSNDDDNNGWLDKGVPLPGANCEALGLWELSWGLYSSNDNIPLISFLSLFDPFAQPVNTPGPEGIQSLCTLRLQDFISDLFIAADGAIFFYPQGQRGPKIIDNPLLSGVKQLHSHQSGIEVFLWGLNQNGDIFYSRCDKKSNPLGEPTSWSYPIPLLAGVEQLSSYINPTTNACTIFARTKGTNMIILTQDPVTTHWHERSVALPGPDVNDVVEYNSYTSHIQVTKDNGLPLSGETLSVTSTSPCSVYIDDVYYILDPKNQTDVKTDSTGTVTIIQEVHSIGAVCYHVMLKSKGETVNINPMNNALVIIKSVRNGADLGKIHVPDGHGGTTPLILGSVQPKERNNVAKALVHFAEASNKMPADGSNTSGGSSESDATWGISFKDDTCSYHEGPDALALVSGLQTDGDVGNWWDAIVAAAGDVWRWVKHAYHTVKNFVVHIVKGVYHFIITIGGKIFRFVMKCISDVVNGVELLFNKIKVFFDNLVKWLGFVFEWDDIVRTHAVIKNIVKRYLQYSVGPERMNDYKKKVNTAFQNAETQIEKWAGQKTDPPKLGSFGEMCKNHPKPASVRADLPQTQWGIYHMKHNASASKVSTDAVPGTSPLLDKLGNLLKQEEGTFKTAIGKMIKDVITDQIDSVPLEEIIKRIMGVLAYFFIDSVKNIVDTAIDVLAALVEGVVEVLDAPIEIPVISWLYKKITRQQLTLLDAVCFVGAIPGTIIFKVVAERVPYPKNDPFTDKLINANSWSKIQALFRDADDAIQISKKKITITYTVLRFVAAGSSIMSVIFAFLKANNGNTKAISMLNGVFFFITTSPAIAALIFSPYQPPWWKIVGYVCYSITVLQKLADMFTYQEGMQVWARASKIIDCLLGMSSMISPICELIPSVSHQKADRAIITSSVSNILWNCNRILSPFINPGDTEEIFPVKLILMGCYGLGELMVAIDLLAKAIASPTC